MRYISSKEISQLGQPSSMKVTNDSMINDKLAQDVIKKALRTIRIVKWIQQGHRSPLIIAEKTNAPLNLVHYYLKLLNDKLNDKKDS